MEGLSSFTAENTNLIGELASYKRRATAFACDGVMPGIRVDREDCSPADWGTMFAREVCFKSTILPMMVMFTLGIILPFNYPLPILENIRMMQAGLDVLIWITLTLLGMVAVGIILVNYLWPIFDKSGMRLAGHDVLFSTTVVRMK